MIIGVEGLPAAEVSLLRTIVKLSSQLEAEWSLSEVGFCHVLLHTLPAGSGNAYSDTQFTVRVVRRGDKVSGECLERPFRAEEFVALLERLTPLLKANIVPSLQRGVISNSTQRGRLKRWPPSVLMGSGPERVQLAALLSRRFRSASELSAATGSPESECTAFLADLEKHGLLSWETPRPYGVGAPAMPISVSATPGLVSSIRRYLGLKWAGQGTR